MHQNLISTFYIKVQLDIKFPEILRISSWARRTSKFVPHTESQKDIFQKQSNCVQDIPKHANLLKTRCRKFLRVQLPLQINIEESYKTENI